MTPRKLLTARTALSRLRMKVLLLGQAEETKDSGT